MRSNMREALHSILTFYFRLITFCHAFLPFTKWKSFLCTPSPHFNTHTRSSINRIMHDKRIQQNIQAITKTLKPIHKLIFYTFTISESIRLLFVRLYFSLQVFLVYSISLGIVWICTCTFIWPCTKTSLHIHILLS